jgi:hypothetical protein
MGSEVRSLKIQQSVELAVPENMPLVHLSRLRDS